MWWVCVPQGDVWAAVRSGDAGLLRDFFLVTGSRRLLAAHDPHLDAGGRTLLHSAAWWGNTAACVLLVKLGADLGAVDSCGGRTTALMEAARANRRGAFAVLLAAGADATLQDRQGDTCLHVRGCVYGHGHTAPHRITASGADGWAGVAGGVWWRGVWGVGVGAVGVCGAGCGGPVGPGSGRRDAGLCPCWRACGRRPRGAQAEGWTGRQPICAAAPHWRWPRTRTPGPRYRWVAAPVPALGAGVAGAGPGVGAGTGARAGAGAGVGVRIPVPASE